MTLPLPVELEELVQDQFGDRLPLARTYADLLAEEGTLWGLIGPREADRIWERHIVNSLCVSSLIPDGALVADIGSGAGLPGIVLGIARPDLHLELVEPMRRRVDFLNLCVERLGLSPGVRVVRARADEYADMVLGRQNRGSSVPKAKKDAAARGAGRGGRPDVVTCRAVASVSGLVTMLSPILTCGNGGRSRSVELLAIKGDRAQTEVEDARDLLTAYGLVADVLKPEIDGSVVGTVVRVAKGGRGARADHS